MLAVNFLCVYQHGTLVTRFVDIMKVYNNQQLKYRELCRERIQRQLQISKQLVEIVLHLRCC